MYGRLETEKGSMYLGQVSEREHIMHARRAYLRAWTDGVSDMENMQYALMLWKNMKVCTWVKWVKEGSYAQYVRENLKNSKKHLERSPRIQLFLDKREMAYRNVCDWPIAVDGARYIRHPCLCTIKSRQQFKIKLPGETSTCLSIQRVLGNRKGSQFLFISDVLR